VRLDNGGTSCPFGWVPGEAIKKFAGIRLAEFAANRLTSSPLTARPNGEMVNSSFYRYSAG